MKRHSAAYAAYLKTCSMIERSLKARMAAAAKKQQRENERMKDAEQSNARIDDNARIDERAAKHGRE